MRIVTIHIISTLLLAVNLGLAQNQAIVTVDEPLADNITRLEIRIEFELGDITIERGNPSKAVTGFIQYNDELLTPYISYKTVGNTGILRLDTESRREGWSFAKLRNFDDYDLLESELYFTTRVPLDMEFSCGLGEATLDLGDLQIEDLKVENGLGETTLDFSTPNPVKLHRLSVENGLGELEASNLGNANTTRLHFDSGLGEADLDFGGDIPHDMDVVVNVGLGSMTFRVPLTYNVELDAEDNFLSSIDAPRMTQIRRGHYRSIDFKSSKPTITIRASLGLGGIELIWTD
jgi:hypothetical protein